MGPGRTETSYNNTVTEAHISQAESDELSKSGS